MMEFKDDLKIILTTLDMSLRDLSDELGFDAPTVSNWLTGKKIPDRRSMEDIYNYGFVNGVYINRAHEKPLSNLAKKNGFTLLFHGSRQGIDEDIDLNRSKENNDFGKAFYLGESIEQSATFVADSNNAHMYAYGLYDKDLKVYCFDVDTEWMLSIAYYRGRFEEYKDSSKLKKIIEKSKGADVIIAPIADNRMFRIIDEFIEGLITDEACMHMMAALNLGKQYVLKTDRALERLGFIREFYLCNEERKYYQSRKTKINKERNEGIRELRSKYRKGKYIEELL